MDDEERDWVPGQTPGPRFSFGTEMRRIDEQLQEMKLGRMIPELPKKKSITDLAADLCRDFELMSSNNFDELFSESNLLEENKQKKLSSGSQEQPSRMGFIERNGDPGFIQTNSLPGILDKHKPSDQFYQTDLPKKKSLDLKGQEFKKPEPRFKEESKKENQARKSEGLAKPQQKRRSSTNPKPRNSKEPGKSASSLTSVLLPAEMIATKPIPPLSREEKSVKNRNLDAIKTQHSQQARNCRDQRCLRNQTSLISVSSLDQNVLLGRKS